MSGTGEGHWELNRPQPAIIKLVEQGVFHGEVLDVGCGIADNAIYIASHANSVNITAIDLVPKAIEVACEKARTANVNIQFAVVDVVNDLSTTSLKKNFYDVILDAALFHVFSDENRQLYIKNLEQLIKSGGLYIQLCFSEKEIREGGPRRIKKSVLNELFSSANGWTIESIDDAFYKLSAASPLESDGRAYLSFIRRNQLI